MSLPFEALEKYVWTWLDFCRLRPKRFAVSLRSNPNDYLSPAQFLFVSTALLLIIWSIAASAMLQLAASVPSLAGLREYVGDPKAFVARRALFIIVVLMWQALSWRFLLWWPLRSPSTIRQVLVGLFYSTGLLVPGAALDALLTPIAFSWIGSWNAENRLIAIGVIFLLELIPFTAVFLYFCLASLTGFAGVKARRLFEAAAWCAVTVSIVTGPAGAFVGAMIDRANGTPFDGVVVLIIVMPGAVSGAILLLGVKKRFPRLRELVRSEYLEMVPQYDGREVAQFGE